MPSISRGEREIDITILGGDFNDVNRGQTVYIGTSPNSRNVGKIRAISASSTQLTIAENDRTLLTGMYLTVVEFYEPWAVFPRILLNEDNVPQFFKDYDIEYSDQNFNLDPVVHMGPNHAMFLDNTPTGSWASIYYSSSGTFDPTDDSIPTGHVWNFEGGMPTASFVADPGYIDYTGAGHFLTSLQVTSNRGTTFRGRRHISVYTRPNEGADRNIISWGMQSFEGSRDNGGYSLRLWLREEADYQKIIPGSLVVLFTEDGEGPFDTKVGGNNENRTSILFNGYVEDGSIALNAVTNRLEFRVNSITGTMKTLASFSATLESKETPETWNEMSLLTVDKAMVHYLRWHTTILAIADFHPSGDTKNVEFMDFERASAYEAVNNLYASALIATLVADRQGGIYGEIDANLLDTGSARNLDTMFELTRQDWRGSMDIQERIDERLSYIELGGLGFGGPVTGSESEPFLSGAPGDAPAYHGSLERVTGLVVTGQEQINRLSGMAFARANAIYPEVIVPMAGDYRIIDIAPQERIQLTLAEEDTYRQLVWDMKPFIPQTVRYQYQAADQVLLMETTLREETHGPPGETVEIPVDPPFPVWIAPEINFPPIVLPPPLDPIPIDPAPGTGELVYVVTSNRLTRTRNFHASGDLTVWQNLTNPLVSGSYHGFRLDPIDPQNVAYLLSSTGDTPGNKDIGPYLFKITNLNSASPTYTMLMTPRQFAEAPAAGPAITGNIDGHDLSVSAVNPNIIWVLGKGHYDFPINDRHLRVLRSNDGGATWSGASGNLINNNAGNDSNRPIDASEHGIQVATLIGSLGTPQEALYQTSNFGSIWDEASLISDTDVDVKDFHVPFQGNGADRLIYYSDGEGPQKRLYKTENPGNTRIDISPNYDGNLWAVQRESLPWSPSRHIKSHQSNRLFMCSILQRNVGEPSDGNQSVFFTATDGAPSPASWVPRATWTGKIGYLDWFKTDVNQIFMLGGNISSERKILGTVDGGLNWNYNDASWERDIGTFGAPDFTGWAPIGIFSVWTV
jgi:hypothetical protein